MKFTEAIDLYVRDMYLQGRFTSPRSERSYRGTLNRHADVLGNQDPRYANRDHVKTTLALWDHPNTAAAARSHLVSFYDWLMEEGIRKDNPARQTRRPKRRPSRVYRLTLEEASAMLEAAAGNLERRAIYIGLLAGLRNQELRGLTGACFDRAGFVHVPTMIAKGGRERWVPVLPELEPVVTEILLDVDRDEFVLPAQRWRDPGVNQVRESLRSRPLSSQALRSLVMRVAKRAGIRAHVHPHMLRHAFGDAVTRRCGIEVARALLGHTDIGTTKTYVGEPTPDELVAALGGFRYQPRSGEKRTYVQGVRDDARIPRKAPTGIEPVELGSRFVEPNPGASNGRGMVWDDGC